MFRTIDNHTLRRFETQLRQEGRSEATIEKYLRDVRRFCLYAGIGEEITKEIVIE